MPPRTELREPKQVANWLSALGELLNEPSEMTLIGSGALLMNAHLRDICEPLPENSMDVDLIVTGDELAWMCYDSGIGSDFEKNNGWHVNIMPDVALNEFPEDWRSRAQKLKYNNLTLILPASEDLLAPKMKRGEPRDKHHQAWAKSLGLLGPKQDLEADGTEMEY